MKLNYDRKSKNPTYFIQKGYRNGNKTTTKNVHRIGKHSELLEITDDPLEYAKEQVRIWNAKEKSDVMPIQVNIDFDEKIPVISSDAASSSTRKNIGYFFLQDIYSKLEISKFLKEATEGRKNKFDPGYVNAFLTYDRILSPGSKRSTVLNLSNYYEEPSIAYQHVMRTMDILEENYDGYIAHLFKMSNKIIKRDVSVCYYDCSNYYFATESPDEEYIDEETGEILPGLRQYGISKDHQPSPIVEMGLFMDSNGIPLSMCIHPGNTNEQTTAIPEEKKLVKLLYGKKFIYCADAGLGSYSIRKFNDMGGRAYVVTQSVKKLSEALKEAVFNDFDYRLLSNDMPVSIEDLKAFDRSNPKYNSLYQDHAYKVLYADKAFDLGLTEEYFDSFGNVKNRKAKGTLKQRVIITFSRKMMEYQRAIRNRQIEHALDKLNHLNPSTYKKGQNDITRFIKRTSEGKESFELDYDRIAQEEKYDGFYAIATNLDDSVKDILEINSRRYKIEDCFRVMKTNFEARPVFHSSREHIIAHFMICYTALLMFRLLEAKLIQAGYRFTTQDIITTLKNMEVANCQDIYYMSTYTGSKLCQALNDVFHSGLDRKNYPPKFLNKKAKKISD